MDDVLFCIDMAFVWVTFCLRNFHMASVWLTFSSRIISVIRMASVVRYKIKITATRDNACKYFVILSVDNIFVTIVRYTLYCSLKER